MVAKGLAQVSFKDVVKAFNGVTAIERVNLDVRPGEFVCIVGPSGCGKSTLLNMLAGLLEPTQGQVSYGGQLVRGPNLQVGYMTQKDLLLPWRRVDGNISFPLELRGWSKKEARRRVDQVLELVGLTEARRKFPYELSGGMRKRTTIARSLSYSPEALLMDEPFGSLDAQLRLQLHDELLNIWEQDRTTVLFVTHDLAEAITLADRVVIISGQPGHLGMELLIEIERPRHAIDVQASPKFAEYFTTIWDALKSPADVQRAS